MGERKRGERKKRGGKVFLSAFFLAMGVEKCHFFLAGSTLDFSFSPAEGKLYALSFLTLVDLAYFCVDQFGLYLFIEIAD